MVKLLSQNRAFFSAAALVLFVVAGAEASRSAGRAGAYLRPAAGASAMALGGAYSAAPDYLMSWYNPAQLGALRKTRVSLGGGLRSLGRTEGATSLQFRVPPRLGMGISFLYRGDPRISGLYDGYYEGGTAIREQPLERMAFTALNTKIGIGYLHSRSLTFGASIGMFYQNMPTTPLTDGDVLNSSVTTIGGFDFAAAYRVSNAWNISLQLKNLWARIDWNIETGDWLNTSREERLLPSFVVASHLATEMRQRPLLWSIDLVNYFPDYGGADVVSPEMVINTGFEWQYWENFFLRAGIGDIEINSDIYRNTSYFFRAFSPRFTAGFSWDTANARNGMRINYALATDRVWAGVDQAIDLTFTF